MNVCSGMLQRLCRFAPLLLLLLLARRRHVVIFCVRRRRNGFRLRGQLPADQGLTPSGRQPGEHMVVLIAGDYQLEVVSIMTATPGVSWVLVGVGGGDMLPINDLGLSINHALHPWS